MTQDLAAALLKDVPRYEPDNPLDSAPSMKDDPQGDWLSRDEVLTALSRTLDPAIAERAGKMLEGGEFDPVSMYEEALGFANGTKVPAKWALWAHSDLVRSRTLITALITQNAALRAENEAYRESHLHADKRLLHEKARAEAAEAQIATLTAQVEGLTGALKFYADESAYETQYERLPCDCCTDIYEPINRDKGAVARAALSATTEASQ